ncbi:MAG: hypothetical protein GTN70_05785 [Deltaproteobacteria bacterium]|nr:hypothetical protein [Deltaproteobacteria bacterium]NIS77191.1 hypothetical protein [Deltaproteobacteria bacterium]
MINCKDVTRLLSESMERELTLWQRVSLRLHLAMCVFCRSFKEQLLHLRELMGRYMSAVEGDLVLDDRVTLPPLARENVKKLLTSREDEDH